MSVPSPSSLLFLFKSIKSAFLSLACFLPLRHLDSSSNERPDISAIQKRMKVHTLNHTLAFLTCQLYLILLDVKRLNFCLKLTKCQYLERISNFRNVLGYFIFMNSLCDMLSRNVFIVNKLVMVAYKSCKFNSMVINSPPHMLSIDNIDMLLEWCYTVY